MWALIVYVLTIPIRYFFRNNVSMVWALSEAALALALLMVVVADAPVEMERGEKVNN